MNRRRLAWLLALAALTALASASAPEFRAEDAPPAAAPAAAEAAPAQPDTSAVDRILEQQEALITGQRFLYDPAGRRDPFRSLFEPVKELGRERPPGAAGMLVAEVDLVGIVKDAAGDLAMVMGSDNKSYFLHVGDAVYDGAVIAIDPRLGTVTFRQKIDDPRIIKPYRDIVKRLVPLGDEESADE
jgi:type IV pilus assembly protein PilP